jgi:hypothetical protein
MPNNVRDLWQYQRPVVETTKNNKKIIIPAFSANCGFANKCLFIPTMDLTGGLETVSGGAITNLRYTFTVECWVKLNPGFKASDSGSILVMKLDGLNSYAWNLILTEIDNGFVPVGTLGAVILTENADTSVNINRIFAPTAFPEDNKWHHVALSFNYALPLLGEGGEQILGEGGEPMLSETGEVNLYLDGILQTTTGIIGDIKDTSGGEFCVGSFGTFEVLPLGCISDVRLWNYVRTPEQIISDMSRMRGILDSGLVAYWPLREGIGNPVDKITGLVLANTSSTITWTNDAPDLFLGFGSSFIAGKFDCAVDSPCSLRFPTKAPKNSNHALCVSWTDEDTAVFYRRLVYGGVGEDIDAFPSGPPLQYRGEKLARNFTFEFWNVDGNATIDLEDDLTIYTSHTSNPNTGIDHSNASDDSPAITTELAANFPFVFPVQFNVQQTYN